jgi:hypothetical protein
MEQSSQNLRKELRYPLDTQAILERHTGEQFNAATIHVSGSGMLVQLDHAPDLRLGEETELQCGPLSRQASPVLGFRPRGASRRLVGRHRIQERQPARRGLE